MWGQKTHTFVKEEFSDPKRSNYYEKASSNGDNNASQMTKWAHPTSDGNWDHNNFIQTQTDEKTWNGLIKETSLLWIHSKMFIVNNTKNQCQDLWATLQYTLQFLRQQFDNQLKWWRELQMEVACYLPWWKNESVLRMGSCKLDWFKSSWSL